MCTYSLNRHVVWISKWIVADECIVVCFMVACMSVDSLGERDDVAADIVWVI